MANLLYPSELREPAEWVNQNAQCILDSVIRAEGWKKVFAGGIPKWLHKLRNYFNVEPAALRLYDQGTTGFWMAGIKKHGKLNSTVGRKTLSGHVYADENIRIWYQMGPGGSIFHWGNEVQVMGLDAFSTHYFRGQTGIPIFKLISPDGTGGSRETIVENVMTYSEEVVDFTSVREVGKGSSKLGEVGVWLPVRQMELHVTTTEHQGSYNFAETSVSGRDWHTKFDVETHMKDQSYFDPRDRFQPLKDRIFTEDVLKFVGANTKLKLRDMSDISLDFEEPPMIRSPIGVSNPGIR